MKVFGAGLFGLLAREVPWGWAIWWLLLPNIMFVAMWPIGGPSMSAAIIVSGIVAIGAVQINSALARIVCLILIFVMQACVYVTKSFNINFVNIFSFSEYVPELNPIQSREYIFAALIFLALLAASSFFATRVRPFTSRTEVLRSVALVALLANADYFVTYRTQGSYNATAPIDAPVDSAIRQNNIAAKSVTADNLVVVIVESWGVPSHPHDISLDAIIWNTDGLTSRYDVRRGSNIYYGSTTNAELREMCGVWADHLNAKFKGLECLPQALADQGFRTMAYHGFDGKFFNRANWYSQIGFDQQKFASDLRFEGLRECGGVFPGICDIDIPRIIARDLRSSPSKRNLIYWLTLNAHLPVSPDVVYGTDRCTLGEPSWRAKYPMLCRSYMVHEAVAKAIFKEISDPSFPEADVLIVGDHMPPFFPRNIRNRFDPTRVPFIYLRNKAAINRIAERAHNRT